MYVIAGATGNVGSVAASELLRNNRPVRVIVRDSMKGETFERQGAEVAVGTLDDVEFLTGALKGADGAFLLVPPNFTTDDFPTFQQNLADGIGTALTMPLQERRERHRVMLDTLRRNDIVAWRSRFVEALQARRR